MTREPVPGTGCRATTSTNDGKAFGHGERAVRGVGRQEEVPRRGRVVGRHHEAFQANLGAVQSLEFRHERHAAALEPDGA